MSRIQDSAVLVTGGAAGLGRMFGERCLAGGARVLVLWDRDGETLERTADELRSGGSVVVAMSVDVSDPEQIEASGRAVLRDHGPPDILYNNAGIVVGKRFQDHGADEIERTIRVNLLGAMHVTRVFLPAIVDRGTGHVVNIASASAYTPVPRLSVYAASKAAMLGWSESLRLELEGLGRDLHVTTITPSYVDTGMFEGAAAPLLTPILDPGELADRMIVAVERNRILLRAPAIVRLLPLLRGLLPARVFDRVVGRTFRVYRSMDRFTG